MAGLHVEDVDLFKRRIWVNLNATVQGGHKFITTPKSGKPRRVPIPAC